MITGIKKTHKTTEIYFDEADEWTTVRTYNTSLKNRLLAFSNEYPELCELIDVIRDKRLRLVIVGSITIDCRSGELDAMSSAFLKMAGVFSELELQMIRARVKSGMANAKAKGKQIGRKPTTKDDIPATFYKHYPAFMAGTLNVSELARVCGLSRPTVYKYLKMMG